MEEIFKQYGGPIITVMVIVGIIALVGFLLAGNDTEEGGGIIQQAFNALITKFQKSGEDAIAETGGTIIFNYFFK